jgi:UDP-glucose:glycoprotein glucosyltransferase
MAFRYVLALTLALLGAVHVESKSVKVGVEASWDNTPLALEASEFFFDTSPNAFWEYVDRLVSHDRVTDKMAHHEAIELCTSKYGIERAGLLRMSLAIREYSPRVELMRQTAAKITASGSSPVIILDGVAHVTIASLDAALNSRTDGTQQSAVYGHEFVGNSETAPAAVLVGYLGDGAALRPMHQALKAHALAGAVRYTLVNRPPATANRRPLDVPGYGVELAIKNMEYKAVDDRQPVESAKDADAEAKVDMEEEVGGFYFNRLIANKPELKDQLTTFKHDMVAALDDANKPLKVWELKNLGAQTLQRIRSSADPLRTLRDVTHNLPNAARSLIRMSVNASVAASLAQAEQMTRQFGGDTFVSLNQKPLTMGLTDPFTLFQVLLLLLPGGS